MYPMISSTRRLPACVAALALGLWFAPRGTFAHVVLQDSAAAAGSSYRAAFRVGHACDGSPTTAIRVTIPAGFQGSKPMPKPGWTLSIRSARLPVPYSSHGKTVTDDVVEVTWTASSKEYWLPDEWYDEFVLRGTAPAKAGPMWFKVLQTCERGHNDWSQIPETGTSTKGLKSPAALLEVLDMSPGGDHQH